MALVVESEQTVGVVEDTLPTDQARFRDEIEAFGRRESDTLSPDTLQFIKRVNPQFHRELTTDMESRKQQPKSEGFSLANTAKQVVGGAVDAITEVGQAVGSFADYLRDTFPALKKLDPGNQFQISVPEVEAPTSTAASVVREASQFLTAFLPFFKATKGLGTLVGGMTAGAVADFAAFDPDDPTLTDTILKLDPRLRNPITSLLESNPDDPEAMKRFRRSIEGLGLGALAEGVIRGTRALWLAKSSKAKSGVKPESVATEVGTEVAARAPRGTRLVQEGEGEVIGHIEAPSLPGPSVQGPSLPLTERTPLPAGSDGKSMAGSVNLDRLHTDADVKQAITEASKVIPRKETLTDEEVFEAASTMGYTLDDAEKLAKTTTEQRAQVLAARQVGVAMAERYEVARKAYLDNPTDEAFQTLRASEQLFLRGFRAQQQVSSNAGFILRTMQLEARGVTGKAIDREINKLLAVLDGKGQLSDDVTIRLASLDKNNTEEVATFLQFLAAKGGSYANKAYEAWISSILSGPQTHAANVIGNVATHAIRPFERLSAATSDMFLSPLQWKSRDRFFGEAIVDVWGMGSGIVDAGRAFARTFRTGVTTTGSKVELPTHEVSIAGAKGKFIRTPLRLLSATDEFFKALSRRGDLMARAYRSGAQQGKHGAELWDHIQATRRNPSEAMLNAIDEEAAYRTFTKQLGAPGQSVIRMRNAVPGLRYIVPFITTPVNITKFGLERTPLKAFDILRKAAKGGFGKGELADDMGKLGSSIALSWWVSSEVMSGNITGTGPSNPEDRRALLATGWQPLSIKVGDEWVSYARIEPFATAIGIVADGTEVLAAALEAGIIDDKQATEFVTKTFQLISQNITDKTFLQGLTEASDVLSDPARFGPNFIESRARAVVPSVVGQAARAQDPLLREVRDSYDAIRAQLPKFGNVEGRQGLYPIRDVFGQAIDQTGNFWYRYLSPIKRSKISATPAESMIASIGARIGKLDRKIAQPGTGKIFELTDGQYDRYQILAGSHVKTLVEGIVPSLADLPKEKQKDLLLRQVQKGREFGKKQMLGELNQRGAK